MVNKCMGVLYYVMFLCGGSPYILYRIKLRSFMLREITYPTFQIAQTFLVDQVKGLP